MSAISASTPVASTASSVRSVVVPTATTRLPWARAARHASTTAGSTR